MIVARGQRSTFNLAPDETLIVAADAVSSGIVYRLGNNLGDVGQGGTAISSSQTSTFGPFSVPTRFEVDGLVGDLTVTVQLATGLSAAYRIARGTATLDGSNPTPVATGLVTIVAAVIGLKQTAAPADDPSWLSHSYSGSDGTLNIYAWKNTGGTDPTLVASTNNTATVDWIAIGT